MDYSELVKNRESIRDYDPGKPVPADVLERILDTARFAPSAVNNQPWEFWIIQSPQMLEKVKSCYSRPWFKEAPQILIVVGDKKKAWVRSFDQYNSLETDLAIVMTHIILAAEDAGVGTCYIEAYDPEILRKSLNLNADQVVYGITPLGYPHKSFIKKGNKIRKSLAEITRYY